MKSILVIDDDFLFSRVLGRLLERCGYRVRVASGGEGIDQFRREVADLVITDLRTPAKDGLETISELHRDNPDLKLIAISAGEQDELPRARRLGASHTFAKPFDTEELLETIEEELGKAV